CDNAGQQERLLDVFDENDLENLPAVFIARLNSGFNYPDRKVVIVCYHEIFSTTGRPVRFPKFKQGRTLEGLWEISSGDYVVHEKYGIGKYRGLKRITIENNQSEYLMIEYRGGDKLYIPIVDFHKVQKYIGIEGRRPKLYSLDSVGWERDKVRAQKSAGDIARQLYEMYTNRKLTYGFGFDRDTEFEHNLSSTFMYKETSDQLRSVEEVKTDMQSDYPMDRIVLGDVGFGKTEVAVRAAFKCALSSKQVAFLAPTTVLAEQHYQTFKERLGSFPVNVAVLTRFQSKSAQKKILADLKKGMIDIVIGTHRLLQNDVFFKDLGLLIIDDEHRFGVKQKEKIKFLKYSKDNKNLVDVLSLTATPIPRTLSMAFSGIKDMSVIETPPEGRKEIETYIGKYDAELVRQAISAEVSRGGQVFYLHNRINTIVVKKNFLQELLPQIKFCIVHGRMKPVEIEKAMYEFMHNKFNCMIATTIIESGLDIPNVNTMIIEEAENFGLAQLYQLRGRIGRGQVKAHCYLFFSDEIHLSNEDARKRLEAIHEFAKLGSGFKLALRDLEIRGAGEILGHRQHGFIQDVGLNLFCQFLNKEVANLKGEKVSQEEVPVIELNISAYIPKEYIEQDDLRIMFYRKFISVENKEELNGICSELEDRFGKIPEPVCNLVFILDLRLLMKKLGIVQVKEKSGEVVFRFGSEISEEAFKIPVLQEMLDKYKGKIEFDANNNLILKIKRTHAAVEQFTKLFLSDLANFTNK
ncbi:MAG: transcription-repair coupling factor, partial [Ignavibacteria bacterium]|nr:transcription-repair coupling factor [Ignavibacteria bacterium]